MSSEHYHALTRGERSEAKRCAVLAEIEMHDFKHPIQGADLSGTTNVSEATIRNIVRDARNEGTPVGSDDRGYFMAEKPEELTDTLGHLYSRRNSYDPTIRGLEVSQARLRDPMYLGTEPKDVFVDPKLLR